MISLSNIRNEIMGYRLKKIYNSGETSMFDKELDREAMRKEIERLTGEHLYRIMFCFVKEDGTIQTDDYGCEEYHSEEVWAENHEKAKEQFMLYFNNKKMSVEIVDIIER